MQEEQFIQFFLSIISFESAPLLEPPRGAGLLTLVCGRVLRNKQRGASFIPRTQVGTPPEACQANFQGATRAMLQKHSQII
jgi:hypothetical protein